MNEGTGEFAREYTEKRFWSKIKRYAISAGRDVIEKALILYYTLESDELPKWARATIYGALGYFILPADAIADITPAVGYADDLGVLVAALAAVALHISPETRNRAREKLDGVFPPP